LDVNLTIAPTLQSITRERIQEVGEVIEEILANSARHGGATRVEIVLTMDDSETLLIETKDNAALSPDSERNIPGLGTKIFNLVSDGRWEITRIGLATFFKIQISLKEKVAHNG
jgi:two-component sensor histidine kinase